jgi:DNA-binding IclR family transcriptional regulator
VAPNKTPTVASIERAFTIIEQLAHSRKDMSISEVSHQLQLPKSTTHTIMVTLEKRGYLKRNEETGKYNLGLRLFSLGSIVLSKLELRMRCLPYLREVMEKTRLTSHLAILGQDEAVYIEKVEAPGMIKIDTWVGRRMDVNCTGVGKALIAYLSEDQLAALIRQKGLPRHNAKTITTIERLKQDLKKVRARGYSIDDEEDELGVRCIGAPIFNHQSEVVASISIAGAISQITYDNLPEMGQILKDTARRISNDLGFEALI